VKHIGGVRTSVRGHRVLSRRAAQEALAVLSLVRAFAEIAIHRRGPDYLPSSRFLLGMLLTLYWIVGLVSLRALGVLQLVEAALLIVDSAFFLAFVFVTLRLFGHDRRFPQTANALVGTDLLLNVIGLPLALWAASSGDPTTSITTPMFLRLLLVLWWIDVAGFIIGRAIARPYIVGVLFVVLYVVASLSLRDFLSPVTA
jgi:hypothetical protein